MSREIKFRAWDKEDCVMRSVLGFSLYHGAVSVDIGNGRYLQDDNSRFDLMQYTGMRYYNDKEEIYEHDVVKGTVFEKGKERRFIGVVKYSHYPTPGFSVEGVKKYEGLKESLHPLFKPIGNIYENPELIGEEAE